MRKKIDAGEGDGNERTNERNGKKSMPPPHLIGILLQVQRDFGTPTEGIPPRIRTNVKARFAVQALPNVLRIVVVALARYRDPIRD